MPSARDCGEPSLTYFPRGGRWPPDPGGPGGPGHEEDARPEPVDGTVRTRWTVRRQMGLQPTFQHRAMRNYILQGVIQFRRTHGRSARECIPLYPTGICRRSPR